MKVNIDPYKNWYGPFQLAKTLCFWAKQEKDEFGFSKDPDWVHKFGEWLAYGSIEPEPKVGEVRPWSTSRDTTWLYKFLLWVDSKKKRKEVVHIDKWDTWSMDSTLALIIVPMLKQLKKTTHGAPFVDDKDVPVELRSTSAPPKVNEWDTDDNHFKRWEWALDEMIFAFESKLQDWEDKFQSGEHDIMLKRLENGNSEMVKGPKDTFKVDEKAVRAYKKRIQNGYRLFGKYYDNLWD